MILFDELNDIIEDETMSLEEEREERIRCIDEMLMDKKISCAYERNDLRCERHELIMDSEF